MRSETMKSLSTMRSGSCILRGRIATWELAGGWRLLLKKPRAISGEPEAAKAFDVQAFAVAA